jgi:hypothetical protein
VKQSAHSSQRSSAAAPTAKEDQGQARDSATLLESVVPNSAPMAGQVKVRIDWIDHWREELAKMAIPKHFTIAIRGPTFRIFDPIPPPAPRSAPTRTGTIDWTPVEIAFTAPGATIVRIELFRERSWKPDSKITGAAWIDSAELAPVLKPCRAGQRVTPQIAAWMVRHRRVSRAVCRIYSHATAVRPPPNRSFYLMEIARKSHFARGS